MRACELGFIEMNRICDEVIEQLAEATRIKLQMGEVLQQVTVNKLNDNSRQQRRPVNQNYE